MSNKTRGCNYERQLVDLLYNRGFAAVRVAGSGARSTPSPDIVACRNGKILAIECKTSKRNQVYISEDQIKQLVGYSETAGARALVAVKFRQREWHFVHPSEIPKTNGSHLVLSKDTIAEKGLTLEDLELLIK